MARFTKETQQRRFDHVKKLAAEGLTTTEIVRLTGVAWQTVVNYRNREAPPFYDQSAAAYKAVATKRALGIQVGNQRRARFEPMPFLNTDVVRSVRDRLVHAFLIGDFGLHAKLTEELRKLIEDAKATSSISQTTLLEAAE